ncbi:MAG: T9SS type A sorting domain-containing protein, partial [Bacteroidales bacterium]|nr:T9SS type A sorting domain-containing protein [Bacteroidales bacterium]
ASLLGLPSGTSILHSILTGNMLGYFRMAQGRLIATGVIAPTTLCPGQSVSVPYTKTHTATGGNVFTAQLSDANGSFINPVSIGSLTTTSNGTISCTIPPGTPTGTGYRIRVVGSIPVVGGTDNGTNLTVNSSVVPPVTEGEFICIGAGSQSVTLTASGGVAGDLYNWYNSPSGGTPLQSSSSTTYSPTVSGATTYYVTIRNTSGCESDLTPVLAGYPPSSNEEQNEPGDGVWKAHVYDGTNFDTYYGSYETAAAAFNESFGGSSACFPISSEYGSQTIQAESFSVRYLMANFPKGLYSVDLGSDDGTKLYVGNDLMCNNWADQSYVVHADVLFAVSEESILKFEYYDNGGGNQVSFESITLILENTLTQNLNQELMLGEVGLAISGDEYGVIPTGIEISGSGYQWTYSLTPDGSRTVIYGAILSTLTPNTALPPFNSPGTYYVRRNGVLLSNNNVNPTLAYATNESNPAVVVVYAGLMDEYRTESSGLWTDPIWQQRHTNDTWSNLGTHPAALSTYTIFPVVKAIATSASTTATMSHTISIPAGVESGDLILIFWEDVSTSTTLGSFSGYTTLVDINSSNMRRKIYYKVANGSEGTSLTVTTSASELSAHVCYLIDAGSYTGTPYISSAHTATSSSPNPPSLSPSGGTGKFVWIPVVLAGEVNTYTAPANYTAVAESHTIYASSSNSHCQVITAFRQYEAATEDPGAFGLGQSAPFHSYTLAIRGATVTNPKSVATIRDGHTATVNANKNIDYLTINSGGTLLVQNGIGLNVSSGAGLTLETGGKITVAGTGLINGAGLYAQNAGSTLEVGSTSGIASSGATGNIQNTGTRTFSAGAHFVYNGSSAQVTGSGLTQNTPGNLTIDNAAGVTLSAATTISGILTMTAGKLNTTTSNLLYLTNTSVGAVVGGSSTSFVDGPLRRKLPESLVSGSTYTFPVGDVASYLPFALVNPTTDIGIIYTTVEAFTPIPGATMDASLDSLSSDEYWSLAVNGSFTSSSVSITRPTAISPFDVIAGSTAAAGPYTYLGGTSVGTYGISNSLAIGSNRYFRFAKVLYTWDGSSSTDWFTANNWTPAAVPTISSSVLIPSTANKPQISGALAEVIFSTNSSLVMSTGSTLTVNAGSLLKFESPTTVTTNGTAKIILEPSAKYINLSASTPALEVRQLISGNKGWRNVSSPVSNSTYSDMFDNLVTQNFTGSNYPLLQPNLMWWDETNIGTTLQGWRQPTNISNSIASGRGHFHYVFDGAGRLNEDGTDSGSDYPDELPIVMTVNGTEPSLFSSAYTFSPFTYTERDDDPSSQTPSAVDTTFIDINVADAGWNLIGNPTPSTLDWDIAGAWTKTNIDNSIYLWDPATNGGEYLTWNGTIGTLGSGLISPFQAFWVHANAASPVLSFSNAAKSEEESEFYGKSLEISNNLVIPLHLNAQDMTTTSFLSFSESGVIGVDSKDAYRLEPMTKSWIALYMNSSLSHTMPLVINNLSVNIDHEFHVPLYINAMSEGIYTGGDYLLSWELPEAWNADLHLLLMDHGTQSVIDMTQLSSYSFSEQTTKSFAAGSIDPFSLPRKLIESATPSATGGFKSSQNQRFSIVIETKATDSIPVYRKSEPLLLPVVPNPVSESAKLCFRLPEAGQVTLIIYNQIGKIIDVPVSGDFPAGLSEVTWYPNVNESGVYFVKMISGETTKTGRMILVR